MLSVDRYDTSVFEVHHILFEKENNHRKSYKFRKCSRKFLFIAPFKYNDADGAPVRAIAIVE